MNLPSNCLQSIIRINTLVIIINLVLIFACICGFSGFIDSLAGKILAFGFSLIISIWHMSLRESPISIGFKLIAIFTDKKARKVVEIILDYSKYRCSNQQSDRLSIKYICYLVVATKGGLKYHSPLYSAVDFLEVGFSAEDIAKYKSHKDRVTESTTNNK